MMSSSSSGDETEDSRSENVKSRYREDSRQTTREDVKPRSKENARRSSRRENVKSRSREDAPLPSRIEDIESRNQRDAPRSRGENAKSRIEDENMSQSSQEEEEEWASSSDELNDDEPNIPLQSARSDHETFSQATSLLYSQDEDFSDSQRDQEEVGDSEQRDSSIDEGKEEDFSHSQSELEEVEDGEEWASSSNEEREVDISDSQSEQEEVEDAEEWGSSSDGENTSSQLAGSESETISVASSLIHSQWMQSQEEEEEEWALPSDEQNIPSQSTRSENENVSQASSLVHSQWMHNQEEEEDERASPSDEHHIPSQSARSENENISTASSSLISQEKDFSPSQSEHENEEEEWVSSSDEHQIPSQSTRSENENISTASSSLISEEEDFSPSQSEQEKEEEEWASSSDEQIKDEQNPLQSARSEDGYISPASSSSLISQEEDFSPSQSEEENEEEEWASSSDEENDDEQKSLSQSARMQRIERENETISQASSSLQSAEDNFSNSQSEEGNEEEDSASSTDEEDVENVVQRDLYWSTSSGSSDPDHHLNIPVMPSLTRDDEEMDKDTDYSDLSSAEGTYTSGASYSVVSTVEVTSNSGGEEERLGVNDVKTQPGAHSASFVTRTVFYESEAMSNDPLDEHYDEERATVNKITKNSRGACRQWAPWACLIVVVLLAVTIGIVVAWMSRGREDGNFKNTAAATRIPGNYCFEDSYDLTYSEPVVNSFVDMVKSTPFECSDPTTITSIFRQQWPNCEMLEPTCCQEDYYSECVQNGGRPTAFGSQEMVICNHKSDGGGMVGVGLSDSIFCAANSCFGDGSDFQVVSNAAMEMTIDTLRSAGGFLECRIADQATIDLLDACESEFQPDGAICDVSEDGSCSFYKVLSAEEGGDRDTSSTCEEYCQQQGGTCLFAGGFGNKCQGRIEDRKSCSEPVISDFCTCATV